MSKLKQTISGNEEKTINLTSSKEEALASIIDGLYKGKPLLGEGGIFTELIKQATEAALIGELDAHLIENKKLDTLNRKNGLGSKRIRSSVGSFDIETPRDRNASFEPQIIKKRQSVMSEELDNKILALYGLGNSYDGIKSHLQDIYGVEVSAGTISAVTDKLLPSITVWRSRPLERIYPIVFLDAMFFRATSEGKVANKVLYNIMGINQYGYKDMLGFYVCESEGAHFWLEVLNDLKARGVEDIMIACIDGLAGFPDAIASAYPNCEVQLCIVHQIRNSLKYVASKNQKEFMADLKTVYKANTKDLAEYNLLSLDEKWGVKYPMVIKSWQKNWDNLSTYFKYSAEIRRIIYTTNPIESIHRQIRKYTKTKGAFTSENALLKLVLLCYKTDNQEMEYANC